MRRLWAAIERALSPGMGYCYRCRRPWLTKATRRRGNVSYQQKHDRFFGLIGVKYHITPYRLKGDGGLGRGCFPLCEGCWQKLGEPVRRLPFYKTMIEHWDGNRRVPPEEVTAIISAVWEGK